MRHLVLFLPLLFNMVVLPAQTSFSSDDPGGIILTKINSQGTELPFTIKDAVKVVRFFMSQEGIQQCESDLDKNTLKIVTRRGYDPVKILLNPVLHNQVSEMGYKIQFRSAVKAKSDDLPVPATSTTKATLPETPKKQPDKSNAGAKTTNSDVPSDCTDCGDQKVSKETLDRLVTPDAYEGSSILIDFDENSTDGGINFDSPGMSEAQLDSLRRVLFKPDPK
ncbi:MAG: hypothetical protein IPM47_01345 [Sphingobacteriales bacterium]|nr:MAG: hypothetical protein IPM47_01345 [Sphingobacteriales bacterium]